jgi:hypothetical protein
MLSRLTAEMCDAEILLETTAVASDSVQGNHPGAHLKETWACALTDTWAPMHLVMYLANMTQGHKENQILTSASSFVMIQSLTKPVRTT